MSRRCEHCDQPISIGRSDKKFCNHTCRNNHHNGTARPRGRTAAQELRKCKEDPLYFFNTYVTINGKPGPHISKKAWDAFLQAAASPIKTFKRQQAR